MKKMLLVDPRLMERLQQQPAPIRNIALNSMNQMNQNMEAALSDPNLSDTDKVHVYNQTLARHNIIEDKMNHQQDQQQQTQQPVYDPVEEDIIDSVPKTMRNKAARLVRRIKSGQLIRWNERGELIYKGQVYPGTNVSDLINDVLRKRKTFQPQGWNVFAEALHDINVPMDLVGNEERWKYMQTGVTPASKRLQRRSLHSGSQSDSQSDSQSYSQRGKKGSRTQSPSVSPSVYATPRTKLFPVEHQSRTKKRVPASRARSQQWSRLNKS